ncbi:MAG: polysaccharide deacetylase family protein [Cyclobacteriaceae bacterium]|nr:polysaccharide deacetylase family protein [Cyclobacteriaceae bacterium]
MVSNFLFHRVSPVRDPLWDPMDVSRFEKAIQYISKNYEVRRLEDLIQSDEIHSKRRFATIVFDDGYKDNIEYGAEILSKYNCKASFYVVTDCIDKNIPTWTFMLDYAFGHTRISKIHLGFNFLPQELRVEDLFSADDRINYVKKFKGVIKKLSHVQRNQLLEVVFQTYNDVEFPKNMMSWNDLKQLSQAGHYIGSHTAAHGMLGTMDHVNEIRSELLTSAEAIEKNLGYFPTTISYPVGSYNQKVIDISKEVGYKTGLAVKQTIFNPEKDSQFEIPRIELYNEPWWKMKLRITNLLGNIKTVTGYK